MTPVRLTTATALPTIPKVSTAASTARSKALKLGPTLPEVVCARAGVPFLLTSSSEVYGKSQQPEFSENDDLLIGPPHQSRWSYACSKLMDEFLALAFAREQGLRVVIARLFNTVGPRQTGQYGMVIPNFVRQALAGGSMTPEQLMDKVKEASKAEAK